MRLVSSLRRLDLTKRIFVFSEAIEYNILILETSRTVVLPPTVGVLALTERKHALSSAVTCTRYIKSNWLLPREIL